MLDQLEHEHSSTTDITLRHLEAKLARYETRIQKHTATPSDYFTRDRLVAQLTEARTYLM